MAALAGAPACLWAQTGTPSVTIEGTLTATDNGALAAPGLERRDLIVSVRPKVAFSRRSAGLAFDVEAAATFLGYANGSQDGGVLPELRGSLRATVAERLLYVDAAAQVRQVEEDAFGTRADGTSGTNRRTEGTYRLSPYIERELSPSSSLLVRHDATLTTNGAGEGARLVTNRSVARVERKPVPVGVALELSRFDSESTGSTQSRITIDTARVRASLDIGEQVVLGVVAGADRTRLLLGDYADSIYGVSAQWNPGPRTEVSASVEQRFFGQGGELKLRHRTPFMSFSLGVSRQPVLSSESLGVVGQGGDIRTFLDGILTTRYPDPAVRSDLVNNLVASRGVDTRLSGAIDVVAQYPQLQTSANAAVVFMGRRDTASVSLYWQTLRQITHDGDPLSFAVTAASDSRQSGGSVQFNRQLTPQLSAEAVVRWSKIVGLAARAQDQSSERSYRLSVQQNLSPRTGLSAGVQYNHFLTTAAGQHPYDATLLLVGMSHRF